MKKSYIHLSGLHRHRHYALRRIQQKVECTSISCFWKILVMRVCRDVWAAETPTDWTQYAHWRDYPLGSCRQRSRWDHHTILTRKTNYQKYSHGHDKIHKTRRSLGKSCRDTYLETLWRSQRFVIKKWNQSGLYRIKEPGSIAASKGKDVRYNYVRTPLSVGGLNSQTNVETSKSAKYLYLGSFASRKKAVSEPVKQNPVPTVDATSTAPTSVTPLKNRSNNHRSNNSSTSDDWRSTRNS